MDAPRITVVAPGHPAVERALDHSPFTVGRDPSSSLVLDYSFVSRHHVTFAADDEGWRVHAHGKNPVTIDGVRIDDDCALEGDTRLEVGPITIVFTRAPNAVPVADSAAPTRELTVRQAFVRSGAVIADLAALATEVARASSSDEAIDLAVEHFGRAVNAPVRIRLADLDDDEADAVVHQRTQFANTHTIVPLGPPTRGVVLVDRAAPLGDEEATLVIVLAHLFGPQLASAQRTEQLASERSALVRDIDRRGRFGALVGTSAAMRAVAEAIAKVAPSEATVLVTGETGSGKELVAREVHKNSARRDGPFLTLNCAALPANLVESELFGHRAGAFSGADRDRPGLFAVADGGTLFLDEVGELSLEAQAKVLRALDAKEILPVGADRAIRVDVRLVAATHRDLENMVADGAFRQDLLFRLKVFPIALPPLRDRDGDVPGLVRHFFASSTEAARKRLAPPTEAFVSALEGYAFPGNVRELAHVIEHACIMADEGDALDVQHLAQEISASPSVTRAPAEVELDGRPLRALVADYERAVIVAQLDRDGWNRTRAAKHLEVSLRAFMDKLKRYGITDK